MTERIAIDLIDVEKNDRTVFEPKALAELAESIRIHGLIQPITVFLKPGGRYELCAGERRKRACELLQWTDIPALVRERDLGMGMLLENVMRAELDPVDEANAYKRRMDDMSMTAEQFAAYSGISLQRIRNRLAIIELIPDAQEMVRRNQLPVTYAYHLAAAGLDVNRQRIALFRLNANPKPSVDWFRAMVNRLAEEQAQESLFDLPMFAGENAELSPTHRNDVKLPPDPTKDAPPDAVGGIQTVARAHADFWQDAARQWKDLGNHQKARECRAAANALLHLAKTMRRPTVVKERAVATFAFQ